MNNLHWDNIIFLSAARRLILAAASKPYARNQHTVVRRIDALETQLGLRLLQCHGGLTSMGWTGVTRISRTLEVVDKTIGGANAFFLR